MSDIVERLLIPLDQIDRKPLAWAEDTMREAAAEIERLRKHIEYGMRQMWQPIETAPKDGTAILLALPHRPDDPRKGAYDYDVGAWHEDAEHRAGWYREDCCWAAGLPTHWMPLPELPEQMT